MQGNVTIRSGEGNSGYGYEEDATSGLWGMTHWIPRKTLLKELIEVISKENVSLGLSSCSFLNY